MSHTADAQPAGDIAAQAFAVNVRRPDGNNYPHGARNRATRGTKQAASSTPGRDAEAGPPACSASHTTIHRLCVASLKTGHSSQTSAFLPTQVQHVCRPTSTPMLNRFYLFYISLFSSPLFYLCMGHPSRHPHQTDRSPRRPPRSDHELSGVVAGGQRVSKSQPSLCADLSIPHARFPFSLVRDFRPQSAAFSAGRLHGRLDG